MSNPTSSVLSSKTATARALALALTACGMAACADDVAGDRGEPGEDAAALTPEQLAALRTPSADLAPSAAEQAEQAAFAAELTAQAQRGQAYLDDKIVPKLDLALRATAGLTYAQLQAEVVAALATDDPKAAVAAFFAHRGPAIEAATAHLGTTSAALGEEVRLAALGDHPTSAAPKQPAQPQRLGGCFTGHEFEPFPPFFQAGNWFAGVNSQVLPTANVNGAIHSEAYLVVGGTAQVAGWVRADNIPPAGAGTTIVSTSVSLSTFTELSIWVPSYAGSGIGLTIQLFDGGPNGTFLGSCRLPVLDAAIPVGYQRLNRSVFLNHSCALHHASSSFLTAKVNVDTYGTSFAPFGSIARAVADAQVQTIRYVTCLD
jgi:hypothetical protein